jgi:hypothetical protein
MRIFLICSCVIIPMFSLCCVNSNPIHADSLRGKSQIRDQKQRMISVVKVGDNIFSAKKILLENGFRIKFGPKFSDPQKTEYLMIVDYGVNPGASDYLEETFGWAGDGKPFSGIIYANKSGRIFRIK